MYFLSERLQGVGQLQTILAQAFKLLVASPSKVIKEVNVTAKHRIHCSLGCVSLFVKLKRALPCFPTIVDASTGLVEQVLRGQFVVRNIIMKEALPEMTKLTYHKFCKTAFQFFVADRLPLRIVLTDEFIDSVSHKVDIFCRACTHFLSL